MDVINRTKIICLVGPSGCGKTTIAKELLKHEVVDYFIKSSTTRPRGENEDEFEYNFMASIDRESLVEYTEYDGNIYGISKDVAEEALSYDRSVVAVDINGFIALEKYYEDRAYVLAIGIDTSDMNLRKRLFARGRGRVEERMNRAAEDRKTFDYCDFTYVNDTAEHMEYITSNIDSLCAIMDIHDALLQRTELASSILTEALED